MKKQDISRKGTKTRKGKANWEVLPPGLTPKEILDAAMPKKPRKEAGASKSKRVARLEPGNEGGNGTDGTNKTYGTNGGVRKRKVVRPVGEAERVLQMQADAVRLKAKEHLTYREIAERLGVTVGAAYKYVQDGLAPIREELEKNGGDIFRERFHATEMLQGLIAKWFPVATAPGVLKETLEDGTIILGDGTDAAVAASHVCIGAVKEIAKILGLNAAVKVAGKIDVNHREPASMSELAARAAKLHSRSDLIEALMPAYRPVGRN